MPRGNTDVQIIALASSRRESSLGLRCKGQKFGSGESCVRRDRGAIVSRVKKGRRTTSSDLIPPNVLLSR